jgi:hypothetical protein
MLGCSSSFVMGSERLGEDVTNLVGPPAIVLDDLVGDFRHRVLLMA